MKLITYIKNTSLEKAIDRVFVEVDKRYHEGCSIVILSDRAVDDNHFTNSFVISCWSC